MAELKLTSPEWSARANGGGEPVLIIKESGCTVEVRNLGDIAVVIAALVDYERIRAQKGATA